MRNYETPEERLLACLFDDEYKGQMADMYRDMARKCALRLVKLLEMNAPPIIIGREVEMIRERLVEWFHWIKSNNLEALCLVVNEDWEKVKKELEDDHTR